MAKAAVDLHIHSCLSPCASMDMTPNNIVNMAKVKGLDIISVCDHNHTGNLKAISHVASERGITFLPGIEIETSEEIHLLCYFSSVSIAEQMQQILNNSYQNILNREDIFGQQLILDARDRPVKIIDNLLTTSITLDLYQTVSIVRDLGGVAVPAHVDRQSYSILYTLGMIPDDLCFNSVEISRYTSRQAFLKKYPNLISKQLLTSSDAHELGMILEREFFIELSELSIDCLISKLCGVQIM